MTEPSKRNENRMVNEVLAAVNRVLPQRVFWLLPGREDPDLTLYTQKAIATVRLDEGLPVFVITSRQTGHLLSWGEGTDVLDATRQALELLSKEDEMHEDSDWLEAA